MENEITKLSQEELKQVINQQINAIGINDGVAVSVIFEKAPGDITAEKRIEIIIEKNLITGGK